MAALKKVADSIPHSQVQVFRAPMRVPKKKVVSQKTLQRMLMHTANETWRHSLKKWILLMSMRWWYFSLTWTKRQLALSARCCRWQS